MAIDSRTLLTEYVCEGENNPLEGGNYSVIANRLVACGGFESQRISAQKMDGHYLIIVMDTWGGKNDWIPQSLAIVEGNDPVGATNRMYSEARRIAEERARLDGNKILDLTSRGEGIMGNEKYYVPTRLLRKTC